MAGRATSRATSADTIDDRPIKDQQADARADQRRSAAREDRMLGAIYDQGRRDERTKRSASSAKKRRPGSRLARTAGRQAAAPARDVAYTGARLAGVVLSLIALYLVLQSVPTFQRFIGGIGDGLSWLRSPTKSIPYASR